MDENKALMDARTLAQIESDMLAAEAAYVEADTRLKQAQRDRDAALDAVNRHQSEIDAAIARLRQRSPAGSSWRSEAGRAKEVLMLGREEEAEAETSLIQPEFGSVPDQRR